MAEPIAVNVIASLPRHISGTLANAVKTSKPKRLLLAANFFTPVPRQSTGKMKAVDSPPLSNILECQAWACPLSKHALWVENGPMRSILLKEIASPPPLSGRRIRRTSQSSRARLRQSAMPEHSPFKEKHHLKFSTTTSASAKTQRAPFIPASAAPASKPTPLPALDRLRKCLGYRSGSEENLYDLTESFRAAKEEGAFALLLREEILDLAHSLANHIDDLCTDQVFPDIIVAWGGRLLELLEHLPSSSTNSVSKDDPVKMSLFSRASSFAGNFEVANEFIDKAPPDSKSWDEPYQSAFLSYVFSMARHQGLYHCLEYLWVTNKRVDASYFASNSRFQAMIANTRDILDVIPPATKWDRGKCQQMLNALVHACNSKQAFRMSRDVIEDLHARRYDIVSHWNVLRTCQGLAATRRELEAAQKLFDTLPPSSAEQYSRVKLYLAGRQGDSETAKELVERRRGDNTLNEGDIANALYSLATRGKIKEMRDLFDEYFPLGPVGVRMNSPNVFHYTIAIQAHAHLGDTRGIGAWLEDMGKSAVEPNNQFFTTLMTIYRQQGDVKGAFATLNFMRKAGVQPDAITYTVLISLLTKSQDNDSADALYMQAIDEGLIPDDAMTNCLMNAHVEAGSWKEAIRIFHHLTSLPAERQPPIDTYNSLLKAYVLVGAPFRLISKLFFKLQDIGGKPDTYTFATLIQSAVDAGQLDIAREVYEETKRRQEATGRKDLVSQHILTILMSSYLRQQKMDVAKELFDEMVDQGLQPTSVTFGAIIKAYGRRTWEERMDLAEDFVQKLKVEREWERYPITKGQHLVNFYGPLLSNYAKMGDVTQVERMYAEFLDAGGRPSIGFFQYLLQSYCIVGDAQKAMELWVIITELAEGNTINEETPEKAIRTRMANIQVPLSVLIDLLSKSGLHSVVASTWSELQQKGFEFDSHNWNHLAVALVRAGEMDRAFEILERVLLPYERDTHEIFDNVRFEHDTTLEDKLHLADDVQPPPLQPPMHNQKSRTMASTAGKLSLTRNAKIDLLEDDEAIDANFAYPLSILEIISPNWNAWRPHNVVLRTLLVAVLQLQRGYLVRPINAGEQVINNVSPSDTDERKPDVTEELLEDLYAKYPFTTGRLQLFQRKEKLRLSAGEFEKIYMQR